MEQQTVHNALDALGEAFYEFKQTNDERLKALEKNLTPDGLIESKLERLQRRLAQLDTMLQRPQLTAEASPDQSYALKAAFLSYARKGELEGVETKALTAMTEEGGGVLIPRPILDKIHSTLKYYSPLRNFSRVTEVSTDGLELLLDRGSTAEVGWVTETAERPETNTPELAKLRIPVHQLYAKPKASQKLLDDSSVDLESWLVGKIADRMATIENIAFVIGEDDEQPRGFLTYPTAPLGEGGWGVLEELKSGRNGQIADTASLVVLFYALKSQYLRDAIWLMPRSALAAVRLLRDAQGQYLWQPSLLAGTSSTLLGHPVVVCDDLPPLVANTPSKSIVFGNFFEGYQIVDRQGMTLLRDPYSSKPYVEFYATKRVGGDVINFEAIKILNCAA